MAKKKGNLIGSWAFLVGVVVALILGVGLFQGATTTLTYVLVIAGLIVGLLNIADEETTPFLMAGAVLIIASAFGQSSVAALPYVSGIFEALLLLFVPATIIVAIRHVFTLARR